MTVLLYKVNTKHVTTKSKSEMCSKVLIKTTWDTKEKFMRGTPPLPTINTSFEIFQHKIH